MKRLITIIILIALAGCNAGYKYTGSNDFMSSDNVSSGSGKELGSPENYVNAYNPTGKEQFVFHVKAKSLQKYGYDKFCPNTKSFACYSNRLQYDKYVGLRCYFDTKMPKKTHLGYEFYPVVLESGEKYYFISNKKYGGKYSSTSPIISLKETSRTYGF